MQSQAKCTRQNFPTDAQRVRRRKDYVNKNFRRGPTHSQSCTLLFIYSWGYVICTTRRLVTNHMPPPPSHCTMYHQEYITPKVCNSSYGVCDGRTSHHVMNPCTLVHRCWVVHSPALGTTLLWALCTVCQHNLLNHVT